MPDGIVLLLRVAVGDPDAELKAVAQTGRPLEVIRQTAAFFVEQILLDPAADAYRVLGATRDAPQTDLRRNMALILRCIHPDLAGEHRLRLRYKGELRGRRGLKWVIACAAQADTRLAETAMFIGSQPGWRDLEIGLTVPATNCRSQILRLVLDARSRSEQLVSGSVWYDDITITQR